MSKNLVHVEQKIIQQLRDARLEQGISYEKLAEKTGLHRTAISLIERNERHPTLLVCLKIANALSISLSKVLRLSE